MIAKQFFSVFSLQYLMLKKRWVIYLFFAAYIQWKMHQIKFGLDRKVKSTGFSPRYIRQSRKHTDSFLLADFAR